MRDNADNAPAAVVHPSVGALLGRGLEEGRQAVRNAGTKAPIRGRGRERLRRRGAPITP